MYRSHQIKMYTSDGYIRSGRQNIEGKVMRLGQNIQVKSGQNLQSVRSKFQGEVRRSKSTGEVRRLIYPDEVRIKLTVGQVKIPR